MVDAARLGTPSWILVYSPLARAIVHSCGSTVNNRPSYRISAFEIKLIFEPSSGIPPLILTLSPSRTDRCDFTGFTTPSDETSQLTAMIDGGLSKSATARGACATRFPLSPEIWENLQTAKFYANLNGQIGSGANRNEGVFSPIGRSKVCISKNRTLPIQVIADNFIYQLNLYINKSNHASKK